MKEPNVNRRNFITKTIPLCAMTCFGIGSPLTIFAQEKSTGNKHKFDEDWDKTLTYRQRVFMEYRNLIGLIKSMQTQMENADLVDLLNAYSESTGKQVGVSQRKRSKDGSFKSFVQVFRPPQYKNTLSHEVVTDTESVFELKVTECIWADVFRQAGLDGDIGHATICNMDYYWPPAFNENFTMERTKTLMMGDEYCNHKYIDNSKKG